jgi:hypothetical protein
MLWFTVRDHANCDLLPRYGILFSKDTLLEITDIKYLHVDRSTVIGFTLMEKLLTVKASKLLVISLLAIKLHMKSQCLSLCGGMM